MAITLLDSEHFKVITREAVDQISLGSTNDWINISSLMQRAYYLGMINALKSISDEKDIQMLYIKIFTETMFSTELDGLISLAIENRKASLG